MDKFKIKLLYNEEEFFCSKTELLNFRFILLGMIKTKLILIGSIFSGGTWVDNQSVTLLLLSNVTELSTGAKTKTFW